MKSTLHSARKKIKAVARSVKAGGRVIQTSCEVLLNKNKSDLDVGSQAMARFAQRTVKENDIRISASHEVEIAGTLAAVYMSNHQSHMDIPVLYATCPANHLRMVGKKELFRIPIWGEAMRVGGMVCIDRSNQESAIQSLKEAEKQFARGVSIWIAPEGTRSKDGTLNPLKKGGFYLAKNSGVPIVPIAINNTHQVLKKGTLIMNKGCEVSIHYGAPIDTQSSTIEELISEVEDFMTANVRP